MRDAPAISLTPQYLLFGKRSTGRSSRPYVPVEMLADSPVMGKLCVGMDPPLNPGPSGGQSAPYRGVVRSLGLAAGATVDFAFIQQVDGLC